MTQATQVNPDQDIKSNENILNNGIVDTDIKADSNLLNDSNTVKEVHDKVLTTQVTSIAREEAATGQKIKMPSAEELYTNATLSFIRNLKHLNDIINGRNGPSYKISRKGMNRIVNSILQLPMDEMPVSLQGDDEKAAFALGQRIIADRFLITHKHILDERKRLQQENENAKVEETNNEQSQIAENKGENNEQV